MEKLNQVDRLPDAVNCSQSKKFTQIPNDLLRNPKLSGKAKAILCLLLSNKEGWTSYLASIGKMMKEGTDAINSGIQELEQHGYLIRFRYRDKQTKQWRGSFWAYTDFPYSFCIRKNVEQLNSNGLEIYIEKEILENPNVAFTDVDIPSMENPGLIILNNKNKNNKIKNIKYSSPAEDKISPKLFEKFWKMYPKKVDKGKALIKWENICTQKSWENKRPTWGEIKKAIVFQTKSERWQDKEYIPHPTTWLNQCRWLDDPKEMISYNGRGNKELNPLHPQSSPNEIIESHFDTDWLQRWMKTSYEGAKKLTGADSPELANELCNLYDWIKENQNPDIPDKDYTNPDGLIKEYIFWLQFQDWVNDITPQTFSPGNNLFRKVFIEERNKETNVNVLTGEFIPSYE